MSIPVNAVRIAQRRLKSGGFRPGEVDGELGPTTAAALGRALKKRKNDLDPARADEILNGSRRRKLVAYIQLLAGDLGVDAGEIDGLWGPQTNFAFEELEHFEEHGELPPPFRDEPPSEANPNDWPLEREAELTAFYGKPGTESNLTVIDAPYQLRLSWELTSRVSRVRCHKKVADSLERVLGSVLNHYGPDQIRELRLDLFGGSYNKRRKRGGTAWSTHAWGIALDFDPNRNQLRWGRDRASFARPEYDAWWRIWEKEGWTSLGRVANFDWMHVQAARRP